MEPDEVKGAASDSHDVAVVRMVVAESETLADEEVSRKRQAKGDHEMQSNYEHNNMDGIDGIDEDLWQHIEAQLRDAKKPVLRNRRWTVLHRAAARGLAEVVGRLLVACPFLINERCYEGIAALHLAAANGHAAIVTQLLAADPTLAEARDFCGKTALHYAAAQGQGAIVTQLLAVNPRLAEARTNDDRTILHCAVGNAAIVTQLLAVNPSLAEARSGDGQTALHFAAREGHTATVTQLLAANPSLIDTRTNDGSTILHEAAGGGHTAIVTQLLALNPTLAEARTNCDYTALHAAAKNGHAAIVAQLLAVNPALLNETSGGRTALYFATTGGRATIAALLLAAKASTETRTHGGRTLLHEAVQKDHNEIVAQLLAANPALIDASISDGSTVLRYAHHNGIIAQLLAARPAWLESMINDADSGTALVNAVKLGQGETAMRMLTMHPNLTYEALNGSGGWTVFHYAAYFGREKVMSWLLSAGVSEPDLEQVLRRTCTQWYFAARKEMTALQLAAMRGHRNIVAQLLAACPSLIDELGYQTAPAVDILLEFKPSFVHEVDGCGSTPLHSMMMFTSHSKESIERVWKMNPDALHAVDCDGATPFHIAVDIDEDIAIDLFQWSLTFAEIAKVYSHYGKSVERFKPLMQLQCEELAVDLLPELVDIVFEYLGFRTVRQF